MSVELARKAIADFLASDAPEVLCLRGKWGTGKTYAWNSVLNAEKHKIPLKSYAYVSLFGFNSLDAIKSAIFENSVNTKDIGIAPSLDSFKSNTLAVAKHLGLQSLRIVKRLPGASDFAASFDSISFLSVRDKLICIDDLERKGDELSVRDVFGLISFLKEQRNCKIAFVLNDDALEDDRPDFDKYFEKVIDVSIEFNPTAQECVTIALPNDSDVGRLMRDNCVALGVSNIRVIKHIERLSQIVSPQLTQFDPSILKQAVQTLVLLGWSKHSTDAPTVDFIKNKRGTSYYGLSKKESIPESEKQWNALLDKYGFTKMDEFDLVLLDGIERGYFDEKALHDTADALDRLVQASKLEGSFTSAWGLYHDSFDNNEAETIAALEESFIKAVKHISPLNLNGTVRLLKDLNQVEKAKSLIQKYVTARKDEPKLFDLNSSPFGGEVNDPDVRAAFSAQAATVKDDRDPAELLIRMAKNSGWNPEDIELLSKLSVDDYYRIFKAAGKDSDRVIGACLLFSQLKDADDKMKKVAENAIEALKKIGLESAINRRRVRKFGVDIPEPKAQG